MRTGGGTGVNAEQRATWQALLEAEAAVANRRAAVHRGQGRAGMLAAGLAIGAGPVSQNAALNYLQVFPREIPEFVSALFELAMGHGGEGKARELLGAGRRADVLPAVRSLIAARLPAPEPEDYVDMAAVAACLADGETLATLVAS